MDFSMAEIEEAPACTEPVDENKGCFDCSKGKWPCKHHLSGLLIDGLTE